MIKLRINLLDVLLVEIWPIPRVRLTLLQHELASLILARPGLIVATNPLDWADHINTFRREQHYRPSPIITNFSRAQKYHDNLLRLICPGKISYLVSAVSWRISSLSSRDIVRASTSWPEETSPPPSCCPDLRGAHSLKNGLMITVMMMIMLTCGWRSVVWVHLMWYELL